MRSQCEKLHLTWRIGSIIIASEFCEKVAPNRLKLGEKEKGACVNLKEELSEAVKGTYKNMERAPPPPLRSETLEG